MSLSINFIWLANKTGRLVELGLRAEVLKLVDRLDSGSSERYARRGSSPLFGISPHPPYKLVFIKVSFLR